MRIAPKKAPKLLGFLLFCTIVATVMVSRQSDSSLSEPSVKLHQMKQSGGRGERRTAENQAPSEREKPVSLDLDKLALREDITEPTKDIFASKSWYVPPPPPPKPLRPAPPPAPTAPPLPFVFMGQQLEGDDNIVVYLAKGSQAYVVRQGDVIDNIYRVESATPRQLVLTYLPLSIQQTLQTGTGS